MFAGKFLKQPSAGGGREGERGGEGGGEGGGESLSEPVPTSFPKAELVIAWKARQARPVCRWGGGGDFPDRNGASIWKRLSNGVLSALVAFMMKNSKTGPARLVFHERCRLREVTFELGPLTGLRGHLEPHI